MGVLTTAVIQREFLPCLAVKDNSELRDEPDAKLLQLNVPSISPKISSSKARVTSIKSTKGRQ